MLFLFSGIASTVDNIAHTSIKVTLLIVILDELVINSFCCGLIVMTVHPVVLVLMYEVGQCGRIMNASHQLHWILILSGNIGLNDLVIKITLV